MDQPEVSNKVKITKLEIWDKKYFLNIQLYVSY